MVNVRSSISYSSLPVMRDYNITRKHSNIMCTACLPTISIGGSKEGAPGTCSPLIDRQTPVKTSCSFRQKNCKIIPIWELAHPPQENPGSATDIPWYPRSHVQGEGCGWVPTPWTYPSPLHIPTPKRNLVPQGQRYPPPIDRQTTVKTSFTGGKQVSWCDLRC